jgi:hypothetical protein
MIDIFNLQFIFKGNALAKINRIQQGLFRQGEIETVFCFKTVKKAGGSARELDRHAAKPDIPGHSDRRIERQNRAGNRRLKQDAVAVTA